MKSCEDFVSAESDYFVYMPSVTAQTMFFYPLYTGHFFYDAGYTLHRDSYDSFLLIYILHGNLHLDFNGKKEIAGEGSFVFLDCYRPHSYHTETDCEVLWCHFDGVTARNFYNSIASRLGNVFYLTDPHPTVNKLTEIYHVFSEGKPVREALLSKYINDILTTFLLYSPISIDTSDRPMSERVISYIGEHFAEDISINELAQVAGLSQYHFIRSFRKETGFTPHEYLINIRINTAKYLLKNSQLSIKDICYQAGFSCESVFCSTFKRQLKMTPTEYRNQ